MMMMMTMMVLMMVMVLLVLQVLITQQATFHDLHILVMLLLSCWLLQRSIPVCTGSC